MTLLAKWLGRRASFEREVSDELRDHLERQTAANIAAGVTVAEARRQAQLQLGAVEGLKESCREERRGFWLDALCADVRHATRMLGKNPGFTAEPLSGCSQEEERDGLCAVGFR